MFSTFHFQEQQSMKMFILFFVKHQKILLQFPYNQETKIEKNTPNLSGFDRLKWC